MNSQIKRSQLKKEIMMPKRDKIRRLFPEFELGKIPVILVTFSVIKPTEKNEQKPTAWLLPKIYQPLPKPFLLVFLSISCHYFQLYVMTK